MALNLSTAREQGSDPRSVHGVGALGGISQDAGVQSQDDQRLLDVGDGTREVVDGRRVRIPSHCPEKFGVWLTTWEAMHFIPCPTLGATYSWLNGHGILRRGNGSVSRFDLERALKKRSRRGRSPASLRNLNRPKAS